MRKLGSLFLQGLAAVLPLALTIALLVWLARSAEAWLGGPLRRVLPEGSYVPGTGVVLGLGLVLAAGIVLRLVLVRRVVAWVEGLFERVPLVKSLYGPLRDVMALLVADPERARPERAVSVDLGDTGATLVGFLTREDASEVTLRPDDATRVAVYLPMSYQIGGYMLLVPRDRVRELDLGVEDVLRTTLTAGLSTRPKKP